MDIADILQSMKTEKKCQIPRIPGSTGLPQNGLPGYLTQFPSSRPNNFEKVKYKIVLFEGQINAPLPSGMSE